MFCVSCGKELNDKAILCPNCGVPTENYGRNNKVENTTISNQNLKSYHHAGMLSALRNFAVFSGRATRKEYWLFELFCLLVNVSTFLIINCFVELIGVRHRGEPGFVFLFVFALIFLLPRLAVTVRRLHDSGRSGTNLFLLFIPFVGPIMLFIFMLQPSEEKNNQYGAW